MRMETSLHQRLEQKLRLAPQIIQSIEILQLPAIELQDLIKQEMLENPTLELVEGEPEPGADPDAAADAAPITAQTPDEREPDDKTKTKTDDLEHEFEKLDSIESTWKEMHGPRSSGMGEDGKDKKLEAMQNTAAKPASLQDYLMEQFALLEITDREREIGEHLIYNIDDTTGWLGYRKEDGTFVPHQLEEVVKSMELKGERAPATDARWSESEGGGGPCTPEEAEKVLKLIQRLEPPGIGARDLKECLLIQLGDSDNFALERLIVDKHLDDLKMNRLPKIAKETGKSVEEIKESLAFISALNPHPGAMFSGSATSYVIPDVICELVDGRYEVRLEDSYIPRIHISNRYRQMLQEQKSNPAVREYIKKKIEAAKWLIESIEQRQNTLHKIAKEIVDYQKGFLDHGIDSLKPLKMQHIADRVGVHVSTVSRAISDKYMQTPRGVFPLKFFFTGGTMNAEGEMESILAVKQKVRDIVDQEDKRNPLSDEDIADKLKEMGYDIARRTVTKYRKQMAILSSRQRRSY
jgi:RNA polymerase sigma-54 factor